MSANGSGMTFSNGLPNDQVMGPKYASVHDNKLFQAPGYIPNYGEIMLKDEIRKEGRGLHYSVESQLLRGTMSFSYDKLRELDPSYTGFTHVFVLKVPYFMTQIASGKTIYSSTGGTTSSSEDANIVVDAQRHCDNLKVLFEMGCTSYSGTPDLTLNTSEVNVGWSERSYPAPTYSAYDGKQFTLKCLETRGEPLRRGIEFYINGITDANVKATMLGGATDGEGNLLQPTLANMTWSFMVVQTDQSMLRIQDISIWNSCIITSIDRSNLDWEQGTIDIVQARDVQFNGVYMPDTSNPLIEEWAAKLLGIRLTFYKRYRDMNKKDIGTENWLQAGSDHPYTA